MASDVYRDEESKSPRTPAPDKADVGQLLHASFSQLVSGGLGKETNKAIGLDPSRINVENVLSKVDADLKHAKHSWDEGIPQPAKSKRSSKFTPVTAEFASVQAPKRHKVEARVEKLRTRHLKKRKAEKAAKAAKKAKMMVKKARMA